MRLFLAIELPAVCKEGLAKIRSDIAGARWVPLEQLHLTLAFLGEVDADAAVRLGEALAKVEAKEFTLAFTGAGCFPNRHQPRVLWAGLSKELRLTSLAAAINAVVRGCSIPMEERPFSPHITLARLKLPCLREVTEFLASNSSIEIAPFVVREFTLFQSRLRQHGAVHLPLRSFPLAPA